MKIVVLNSGSNSVKFEVIDAEPNADGDEKTRWGTPAISGAYDKIGKPGATFSLVRDGKQVQKVETEVRDHGHASESCCSTGLKRGVRRRMA